MLLLGIRMQAILAKTNKAILAQKVKSAKNNIVEDNAITILENTVIQLEDARKALEEEIRLEEGMYKQVATTKLERRLKKGITAQTAASHKNIIDSATSKLDAKKEQIESKISDVEASSRAEIKKWEASIERVESDKASFISKCEAQIESFRAKIEESQSGAKSKVRKYNADIELQITKTQGTLDYYNPLLERCYEEEKPDVIFPPSHYKKKEKLQELELQIKTSNNSIMIMKASEFDNNQTAEERAEDAILKKRRQQAINEDRMLQAEADARDRERELEIYAQKRAEREQERKRVEEKRARRGNQPAPLFQEVDSDYDTDGELLTKEQKASRKLEWEAS